MTAATPRRVSTGHYRVDRVDEFRDHRGTHFRDERVDGDELIVSRRVTAGIHRHPDNRRIADRKTVWRRIITDDRIQIGEIGGTSSSNQEDWLRVNGGKGSTC